MCAWYFNAGDAPYLSAGDITDLDTKTELSFHIWSYLTSNTTERHMMAKWDGTDGFRLYFDNLGLNTKVNIPVLRTRVGGSTCRAEGGTDNLMALNTWYAVGGSWKPNVSDGVRVYLDGTKEGEASTTSQGASSFPNLATPLYVGRQGTTSASWYGRLGECAIWDERLDDDEFKALAQGVPAFMIRPWALLFYSAMRKPTSSEYYSRPKADVTADFTHYNVSTVYADDYPYGEVWLAKKEDGEFSPVAAGQSWSSWAKIRDDLTESYLMDTGLENGKGYEYYLVAVDTSGNPSVASTTQSGTPSPSVQGPPLVIPYSAARKRVPILRLLEEEEVMG